MKTALLPSFLLEESYPVAQRSLLPSAFSPPRPPIPAARLRFLNPAWKTLWKTTPRDFTEATVSFSGEGEGEGEGRGDVDDRFSGEDSSREGVAKSGVYVASGYFLF